ncbi:superoxide dismutase [Mycoplasmatota bacterium WC44]
MYRMVPLSYSYSDFLPYIDGFTMNIHYNNHYKSYLDKLNKLLKDFPVYFNYDINTLLYNIETLPNQIKEGVRKFGGGYSNHNLFWRSLVPVYEFKDINDEFKDVIIDNFGSYEKFMDEFKKEAYNLFGSGWVFLVLDNCKLRIVSTKNQDSPLMDGLVPILTLDLWEHAYYLNYQYKRKEYISNFFKIINWNNVYSNYKKLCKLKL